MLTGINIYETKPYHSKLDPEKDNPTVFHIGLLDSYLRAYIDDQATSFEFSSKNKNDLARANVNASKHNLLAVRFGLKFDTVSVSIIGKNYMAVSEEILAMLPKVLIDELAEVILSENTLSGEKAKN
jgi:hypothetical protein